MLALLRRPCINKIQTPLHMRSYSVMTKRQTIRSPPRSLSLQPPHRPFSLWSIPLALIKTSPIKRRLALVGLSGLGVTASVLLGPLLLVGVGGIAAVIGFRVWRFKRQLQQELERKTSSHLNEWPDLLNAFIQQQTSFFGQDQRELQKETMQIVQQWVESSQGRHVLDSYGMPHTITNNVSMRGSYSSTHNDLTEIKIELELRNAPGHVLVSKAVKEKERFNIKDIQLVTSHGQTFEIPLSSQNRNGGRIIEGEFHDVK